MRTKTERGLETRFLASPSGREGRKKLLDVEILFPEGDISRQQLHGTEPGTKADLPRGLFRHSDNQLLPVGHIRFLRIRLHLGKIVQALDLGFAGAFPDRVKNLPGSQIDLPTDNFVLGDRIALNLNLIDVKLLPLLDAKIDVNHAGFDIRLEAGFDAGLPESTPPVFVLQGFNGGLQAIDGIHFAGLQTVDLDHLQIHLIKNFFELGLVLELVL